MFTNISGIRKVITQRIKSSANWPHKARILAYFRNQSSTGIGTAKFDSTTLNFVCQFTIMDWFLVALSQNLLNEITNFSVASLSKQEWRA